MGKIKSFLANFLPKLRTERIFRKKVVFWTFFLTFSTWLFWGVPLPTQLSSAEKFPVSTKLFDRNGKIIYEIFTDKRRTPIKLNDVPDYVKESTISIEDKDFYKHYGFSPTGIARSIYKIVAERKLQGGSFKGNAIILLAAISWSFYLFLSKK